MKQLFTTCIMCIMFLGTSAAAQDASSAPIRTPEQKLAFRDAQHKLDAVEKQQKDLAIQIGAIQQNITNEQQRLNKQHEAAQAALDEAKKSVMAGVDEKLWKWDDETLTFTAVPAPAAPANASTQPAKPASSGSPGAAVPPKVEQAKK